ncbi:hypothetical protein HZB02_06800 [Candidatus Woesearchaeota archaeon]|nr:hypothetical protein [Candidatus Woesearchaeota archaeon]
MKRINQRDQQGQRYTTPSWLVRLATGMLFVMIALLIVGSVFAEDGKDTSSDNGRQRLVEKDQRLQQREDRLQQKEQRFAEKAHENANETRDEIVRSGFMKRQVIKNKELMVQQQKDMVQKRLEIKDLRTDFTKQRKTLRECMLSRTTAENLTEDACGEARDHVRAGTQSYLNKLVEIIQSSIVKAKTLVEQDDTLTDAEASQLTQSLDAQDAALQEVKTKIGQALTSADFKADEKQLRAIWYEVHDLLQGVQHRLTQAKVRGVIAKALLLEQRLDDIVAAASPELKVQIEPKVSSFHTHVEKAQQDYSEIQQLWTDFSATLGSQQNTTANETRKATLDQITALIKDAQQEVKAAHEDLQSIVALVKENKGSLDDPNKPAYVPGKDLGVYVWQDSANRWKIFWSGNNQTQNVSLKVTSDGLCGVQDRRFERKDTLTKDSTTIRVNARVKPAQDGMVMMTSSPKIHLEGTFNGNPALIFVGTAKTENSGSVDLDGKAYEHCKEVEA